jgi:hypothetical protein
LNSSFFASKTLATVVIGVVSIVNQIVLFNCPVRVFVSLNKISAICRRGQRGNRRDFYISTGNKD